MAQFQLNHNANTFIEIDSPFKDDVVLIRIDGGECLSECFSFQLELVSKKNNLSFDSCVGRDITATIMGDKEEQKRYVNGIVNRFEQRATYLAGTNDEYTLYYMEIVPLLWFLKKNAYCRVFEALTYQQIIEQILGDYKIKFQYAVSTEGKFIRDLTIQYNESDFNFVNRLLEEEGVYYFFKHEQGKHTMIITDQSDEFISGSHEALNFIGPGVTTDHVTGVTDISLVSQVVPSSAAVDDYNFMTPDNDLIAQSKAEDSQGGTVYHYPGKYWDFTQKDGEAIAKIRLEKEQVQKIKLRAQTSLPQISQGYWYEFQNHPRTDLNKLPWVVESVKHHAELKASFHDLAPHERWKPQPISYQNHFFAFDKKFNYRPALKTQKPKISTQTAVVIGKENEEIWTDEYGRIHVKFHWDARGDYEDQTSCWVRVMMPWSGNDWGIRFTPRIGQEVVVQFLESDPDHPIVTGCVYNDDNRPPYLPDSPTVSTIKTNSSPGGEGYNEIRFEDKKEEEQLFIHAQRDMDTLVEANQTVTLTEGDRTVTLHAGNYTRTLEKGDETISLEEGNRLVSIKGGDETHENEQNFTHTIKQNDTRKVEGDQSEDVTGNVTQKIEGNYSQEITGNAAIKVGGNYQLQVTGDIEITATGAIKVTTTAGYTLMSSANVEVTAGAQIMMTGSAGVAVTSDAVLSLTGNATAQLTGTGMCEIVGGMVMINS
jgi:type VI secretion system secreted protein VgrG